VVSAPSRAAGLVAALLLAALERSDPPAGATLREAPRSVTLAFNEPVEAKFGAVRVFDARGEQVDEGETIRAGGRGDRVGVALRPDLPDGPYTVAYRVVSADSHPVNGGFVFTVGKTGGLAAVPVDEVLADTEAGGVTATAFAVVRALGYAATAVAVGGMLFVALCWVPALAGTAEADPRWRAAADRFAVRARRLIGPAVAVGLLLSIDAFVLQGATAAGTSFWGALNLSLLEDVATTRAGTAWLVRVAAWVLLAGLVALGARAGIAVTLRPATLGATGVAVPRVAPLPVLGIAAAAGIALALAPGLGGHAGVQSPSWLYLGLDAAHVAAMSAWIGGLVFLVVALPAATRKLEPRARSRLLAAVASRFSPLALGAVAVLAATGVVQAIAMLPALPDLWSAGYGRLILAKIALLVVLVALGAVNRQRTLPRLRRIARIGEAPGGAGRQLARTLRAEVALLAAVLALTAALVGSSPPGFTEAASGPASRTATLGPARLDATIDPARPGRNEVHLYLFDSATGAPYRTVRTLEVTATQTERDIGPIALRARRAGPGHFVITDAQLAPAGTWEFRVDARASKYDAYTATFEVPVR
jgi:copper transport protein